MPSLVTTCRAFGDAHLTTNTMPGLVTSAASAKASSLRSGTVVIVGSYGFVVLGSVSQWAPQSPENQSRSVPIASAVAVVPSAIADTVAYGDVLSASSLCARAYCPIRDLAASAGAPVKTVTSLNVAPPSVELAHSAPVYCQNCRRGNSGSIATPPASLWYTIVHVSGLSGRIAPLSCVPTSSTASLVG